MDGLEIMDGVSTTTASSSAALWSELEIGDQRIDP